jgi:signal transduction histidine kinase
MVSSVSDQKIISRHLFEFVKERLQFVVRHAHPRINNHHLHPYMAWNGVRQVISNLISNAIQHTTCGAVTAEMWRSGTQTTAPHVVC